MDQHPGVRQRHALAGRAGGEQDGKRADGGGKALAAIRPLHGAERIARLFWAVARRGDRTVRWQLGLANGEPAVLRYRSGQLVGITVAASAGGRITALYTVANPEKLAVTGASAGTSWW